MSIVHMRALLLPMIHDNDDNHNQKQKHKQNYEVFANGASDTLASIFLCQHYQFYFYV